MAATKIKRDLYPTRSAYNGNAAYDLSDAGSYSQPIPGRVRQPARPKKHSQETTRSRANLRVRTQQKISPIAIAGFLAVAALAVVILMSYVKLASISEQVSGLRGQLSELKEQGTILQAKYERIFDLNAIEEQFTALGTMAKPRADQMVYIDMSEPDHAEVLTTAKEDSAVSSVKNFFAMAVEYFK